MFIILKINILATYIFRKPMQNVKKIRKSVAIGHNRLVRLAFVIVRFLKNGPYLNRRSKQSYDIYERWHVCVTPIKELFFCRNKVLISNSVCRKVVWVNQCTIELCEWSYDVREWMFLFEIWSGNCYRALNKRNFSLLFWMQFMLNIVLEDIFNRH